MKRIGETGKGIFATFALVVTTGGSAFAVKPGDEPCDGHPDAKKKWDIQKGQNIYVNAKLTADGVSKDICPDTKPVDWGRVSGRQIAFQVDAHDRDDHVCKIPQSPVLNWIQPSELTVTVHRGNANGQEVGRVTLDTSPEPRERRRWTGSWEIPDDLVGRILVFVYEGRVDDVPCATHTASDDDPVDLTTPRFLTAVKINGRPAAYLKPTGKFDFEDPKTLARIGGEWYSPPDGYSRLEPKELEDQDLDANGDVDFDTFNRAEPVRWTGWNSVFEPVTGTPDTDFKWTGPGPDKAEADVIMNLDDDGRVAEDGGYQDVASQKVYVPRVEITGPEETEEGRDSDEFTAAVIPSTLPVDSYHWTWEAPQGAGNNPAVNFAAPDKIKTIVRTAHWFALPDNRLASVTGYECKYTINCAVVIGGNQFSDATPPLWKVWVSEVWGMCVRPQIVGMPSIGTRVVNGAKEWFVSGKHTLSRSAPHPIYYIPATSQFRNKAEVHENRHVEQYTTGVPGIPVNTLWDADALYNTQLVNMTSRISEEDLSGQIERAIAEQNAKDDRTDISYRSRMEWDAQAEDKKVPPHYLELR